MSAQANVERGEISLTLDADYVLRPTFTACSSIEEQTGKSLIDLCYQADERLMSMKHAGIIVAECIRAWGHETEVRSLTGVQAGRVTELIFEAGLVKVMPRIAMVLLSAVTGGATSEEEKDGDDSGEPVAAGTERDPAAD